MASYDSGSFTISPTSAAPHDILRLNTHTAGHQGLNGGMDAFDHDLNFEGDGMLYVTACLAPPFASILERTGVLIPEH